ncbi:MAG: hypothetical protein K0B09_02425 [Bacteroidales bacterium]|nr:hypothetical protein [Bacteroidales bacterium]
MKKFLFSSFLLAFGVVWVYAGPNFPDSFITGVEMAVLDPDFQSAQNSDNLFADGGVNYSPVFGGRSRDRRQPSEASKRSQSRRHSRNRTQSYSPPESASLNAGTLGSDRPTPTPSMVNQTRGRGRQPLRMSERDRYFGVGSREMGFSVGTAHSFTDLQGSKGLGLGQSINYQVNNPGFTLGVYSKFRMVEWFGLSLGLDYARLTGSDEKELQGFEGYSFENNLLEFNARIAFYAPLPSMNTFDIYGFAGLGLFANNLKLMNADGFEEQPIGEFRILQPAIPFGVGFSWLAGFRTVIGYEFGYRYTAFNLLDGVEPTDTRYDGYLFNAIRIGFIMKPRRR